MNAQQIAIAFTTQNDKKVWSATARVTTAGVNSVYFTTTNGMVSLIYDCTSARFMVKFHKFQGAWGDYTKAIARSLYTVLTTLKSAGLPFEAPPAIVGIEIVTTIGDDNSVYVRWAGERTVRRVPTQYGDGLPGGIKIGELQGWVEPTVTAFDPVAHAIMPEIRTPEAVQDVMASAPPADDVPLFHSDLPTE